MTELNYGNRSDLIPQDKGVVGPWAGLVSNRRLTFVGEENGQNVELGKMALRPGETPQSPRVLHLRPKGTVGYSIVDQLTVELIYDGCQTAVV